MFEKEIARECCCVRGGKVASRSKLSSSVRSEASGGGMCEVMWPGTEGGGGGMHRGGLPEEGSPGGYCPQGTYTENSEVCAPLLPMEKRF